MGLDRTSFYVGFFWGFVLATAIGFTARRIQIAIQGMGAPDRPMNVQTSRNPRDVMGAAARAFRDFMVWIFILIVLIFGAAAIFYVIVLGDPFNLILVNPP